MGDEGDGCVRSRPTEIVRQAHKQGKQGKGMNKTGEESKADDNKRPRQPEGAF